MFLLIHQFILSLKALFVSCLLDLQCYIQCEKKRVFEQR